MKSRSLTFLAASVGLAAAPLAAQPAAPAARPAAAANPATPPATPRATAAALGALARTRYVLPATGQAMADALAAAERRGAYKGLAGEALAARLDATLHSVSADKHVYVHHDPGLAATLDPPGLGEEDEGPTPEWMARMARVNWGVKKLELLPGNVRYADFAFFFWGNDDATRTFADAMAFLRGGDAIIIDLRNNGGGDPLAVAAVTGYFLPQGTPLARFEMRGRPNEDNVAAAAPFSLAGKPLYVLTSAKTASAGEEFAAHVAAFKLGTLIGATTNGAGYRNDLFPLPGGLVASLSIGRVVHAQTRTDWEGKGIAPAIAVPADQALDTALAHWKARAAPAAAR